jgi:type IV pilus assembly protein PilN
MRITLNLATRPFADAAPVLKRLRIAMALLVLLSIGLGLGLHALHSKAAAARARDHSLDGAIAGISRVRQGYLDMMRQPDNARLLTQVAALNQIFDEKAFSWTLAMENLETVLPGGVQVTAIEPIRDKDGHITLHLRVAGPHDLADQLVQNLEHSRRFFQPRIVGETAESNSNGAPNQSLEPVSASNRFAFDLLAEYNPPTPEEEHAAGKAGKDRAAAKPPETAAGAPAANAPRGPHRVPGFVPTAARRQSSARRRPAPARSSPTPAPAAPSTGGPQ